MKQVKHKIRGRMGRENIQKLQNNSILHLHTVTHNIMKKKDCISLRFPTDRPVDRLKT